MEHKKNEYYFCINTGYRGLDGFLAKLDLLHQPHTVSDVRLVAMVRASSLHKRNKVKVPFRFGVHCQMSNILFSEHFDQMNLAIDSQFCFFFFPSGVVL